ncbi:MAG: transporter [Bradyrhizobium sp.]|nr:transporter [Bradyrhizobium sp.]
MTSWRSWTTLAILVVCAVLSYTDRQVLTLLVEDLRRDLAIGDTEVSLLIGGLFAATYGIAGVAMGIVADRANRRLLIVFAIAGWSVATLLCGLATAFWTILLARLAVAACEAALTPAALSLISDAFARETRGRASSIYIAAIPLGGGLSIAISGLMIHLVNSGLLEIGPLAHLASWRVVLLAFGFLGFGFAVLALFIAEPAREARAPDRVPCERCGEQPRTSDFRQLVLALWPLLAAMALVSFATNATAAWLPTVLIREFGYAPARAGLVLGITVAIFGVAGVLAGGWFSDRAVIRSGEGGRLRFCLAATLAAVPFALFGALPSDIAVIAGAAIFLFLVDAVTSAGLSSVVGLAPSRMRATAVAVSFLLNVGVGGALGAPMVAIVHNKLLPPGTPIGIALALVVSVGMVGAAAALLARRRSRGGVSANA